MADYKDYEEMDWDTPIDDSPARELLPAGDYDFTIDRFDREWYDGSEKTRACKRAVIYLNVISPDGTETQIRDSLLLTRKLSWRISQLFIGVGLMKEGEEKYVPEWEKLPGLTGRAKIKVDVNKDDPEKKYNNIDKYYPKKNRQFSSGGGF